MIRDYKVTCLTLTRTQSYSFETANYSVVLATESISGSTEYPFVPTYCSKTTKLEMNFEG